MEKFTAVLTVIARAATGVAFMVIIVAVVVQLLGRSGIISSVVWTEELTRFALLYLAAFGVGLSYRSGNLVNVDIVCEALPERAAWLLRRAVDDDLHHARLRGRVHAVVAHEAM